MDYRHFCHAGDQVSGGKLGSFQDASFAEIRNIQNLLQTCILCDQTFVSISWDVQETELIFSQRKTEADTSLDAGLLTKSYLLQFCRILIMGEPVTAI